MRTKRNKEISIASWRAWIGMPLMGLILPGFLMAQTSSSEYQITQHSDVLGGQAVLTNTITTSAGPATMTITAGQAVVGDMAHSGFSTNLGFWSFYLKEPDAPLVDASDGESEHPASIYISAVQDVLSPPATGEYTQDTWILTRDGGPLQILTMNVPSATDGEAIFPGKLYSYGVTTSNSFGVSPEGFDIGFTLPNGIISGRVRTPGPTPGAPWTPEGNPVADVEVSLLPILGKSALLDGQNDFISIDSWYENEISESFTIELWINIMDTSGNSKIMDMGDRFQLEHNNTTLAASIGAIALSTALPSLQAWHHIACVMDTNMFYLYLNSVAVDSASCTTIPVGEEIRIGKNRLGGEYYDGWVDDIRVWNSAREQSQILKNMERALFGDEANLIGYWRFDEGLNNISYDATSPRELAVLEGATWHDSIPTVKLSAFTDTDGYYEIRNVWYETADANGTTYTVAPAKANHDYFTPADDQVTLTRIPGEAEASDVKFLDESLFTVSGTLIYGGTNCAVVHAEILVDSASTRPETFTNSYGKYTLDFEPDAEGHLTVRFGGHWVYDTTTFIGTDDIVIDTSYVDGHTFHRGGIEQGFQVPPIEADIAGIHFENVHTESLYMDIGGGTCMLPIGDAEIILRASGGDCFADTAIIATGAGYQAISGLPPLEYEVIIKHATKTYIKFDNQNISLVDSSAHMELMYRDILRVSFSNFPWDVGCAVIAQHVKDSLKVTVYEEYGGYDDVILDSCFINSFSVELRDDWSGIYTDPIPFGSDNGEFWYHFQAGIPNVLAGGDHPYEKELTIVIHDELGRFASDNVWAKITGRKISEGSEFASQPARTSEMPLFVLRDPPGDESYSFLAEDQTICRTISLEIEDEFADDNYTTVSLGVDFGLETGISSPFGSLLFSSELDITLDFNETWGGTQNDRSLDETEICITTSELFQTDGEGLIVGDEGDIYVGATLNLTFSQILDLSVAGCDVTIDTSYGISDMDGFHSFYVYSDYHIRRTLIPNLVSLRNHAAPEDSAKFAKSVIYWENLVQTNVDAKAAAIATDAVSNTGEALTNISFDALASYEYSTTTDSAVSHSTAVTISTYDGSGNDLGVTWSGVGVVGGFNETDTHTETNDTTDVSTYSHTVGFSLGDDDPGDAFTVDIKRDPVWGMPVFDLLAGRSSNPWEPKTFKRQWSSISISPPISVDNEPDAAVLFDVTLGNLSETGETWPYSLSAWNESNPDGAVIMINGIAISGTELSFEIDAGQTVNATMLVERGPVEYDYEALTLEFGPPGELEIADILGEDTQNSGVAEFTVRYIKPCSEVTLSFPEYDGWLINQSNGLSGQDSLRIDFSGFNKADSELVDITLEYTRTEEEEWFPGAVLTGIGSLPQAYSTLYWNTSSVPEGEYYIRARAACRLRNSYSELRMGTIDRTSPRILGVPEPADVILNSNDQIILTLTEDIDCDQVYPNSGELFFAHTGKAIAAEVTCSGNQLVITPATSVSNREIENQLLKAQVQFVKDLAGNILWDVNGNVLDTLAWEFTVDRNPLHWNVPELEQIAYLGEETIIPITLNNNGAAPAYFEFGQLFSLPDWVVAEPANGEVNSGGSMTVYLYLDPYMNMGNYQARIYAETPLGDEPLDLNIHTICRPPEWIVEASNYEHTMTLTAELSVQGSQSADIYDRLGAFVGDECRGVADMEHLERTDSVGVDESGHAIYETTHFYRTFLTAYSNEPLGDTLEFRIWDASHCDELWEMDETLVFQANTIVGSLIAPSAVNATGAIAQHVDLSQGWTWFSFNLQYGDMSFNQVFNLLEGTPGDRIIAAETAAYAQYAEGLGWVGPLTDIAITNIDMYQADMVNPSSFPFVGFVINPENTTIGIEAGWNRISYTPQVNMELPAALAGLTPSFNDQIKNQTGFAQYDTTYGWYGSLDYLTPGSGYMLRMAASDSLIYPSGYGLVASMPELVQQSEVLTKAVVCPWDVDKTKYLNNMAITALIESDTLGINSPEDAVVAFIGDECRGIGRPVYVPEIDAYRVFMQIYGDEAGQVTFTIWQAEGDLVYQSGSKLEFEPDELAGDLREPYMILRTPLGIGDKGYIPDVFSLAKNYPNPFNPRTTIGFGVPEDSHVRIRIFNLRGQEIRTLVNSDLSAGYRFVVWNSLNDGGRMMTSGVYLVVMESGSFRQVQKMLILK